MFFLAQPKDSNLELKSSKACAMKTVYDSEIEIYMKLTFRIFPITPCKLAGHVNGC